MADFTIEAQRVKDGNSLSSMQSSAQQAIAQLATLKSQLLAMKAKVQADPTVYTAEDTAKVQAVIVQLAADIQTLL